jgi:hypothetical protein
MCLHSKSNYVKVCHFHMGFVTVHIDLSHRRICMIGCAQIHVSSVDKIVETVLTLSAPVQPRPSGLAPV